VDPWSLALVVGGAVAAASLGGLAAYRLRRRPSAAPPAGAEREPTAAERLRRGLLATRRRFSGPMDAVLRRPGAARDAVLAELEEILVSADVGVRLAGELIGRVRERIGRAAGGEDIRRALREELEAVLAGSSAQDARTTTPWVVLVLGVNGVGKTTTIGKLAALHRAAGRRVLLVAADTFRAAAADQLAVWAERTGAELIRQDQGADPSAVVFDGMKAAVARRADVVLIDTAGRLHTRANLMDELAKVRRVIGREMAGAPQETLLVLDATTGQNAVAQARTFAEKLGVTGLVLTKLDGTARGGVIVAVRREIGVPVQYIGVGEGADDLRPFDAGQFVDALFDPEGAAEPSGNP
jgi:fused signal recognition particle receptor